MKKPSWEIGSRFRRIESTSRALAALLHFSWGNEIAYYQFQSEFKANQNSYLAEHLGCVCSSSTANTNVGRLHMEEKVMEFDVCVVTGGAGFIGSHVVTRLIKEGIRVRVIDNLTSGAVENFREVANSPVLEFVQGDIRNLNQLYQVFEGADVVFHQAALTSVPASVDDPVSTHDVNITGSLNVLSAAQKCKIHRVVLASSSAVYGNSEELPNSEIQCPQPESPYAISKCTGEKYATFFSKYKGIETVCLRYFNVYGPRQNPQSEYAAVIPIFITSMLQGERPVIYGNGEQTRDFVHVDDVVEANLLAASTSGISGEVFNIAAGESYSVNQLVELLNGIIGVSLKPQYQPERKGDVKHSSASVEKARKMLGFMPSLPFEEGLRKTVDWYRYR